MATSGRYGPTSTGSRSATTSGIAKPSSRWRPWSSNPSPLPSPTNSVPALRFRFVAPARQVMAKSGRSAGSRFRVVFVHAGTERTAEAGRVVNGAGRIASIDTLDLEAGQVTHIDGRITLDRHLRSTSNPQVHVCGDAVPVSAQLSPIATYEGDIVGRNIVEGPKHSPDYEGMATAVYTVPSLAAVGLTDIAAQQKGLAIQVHVNDMHDWFSARSYAEPVAWSKVIVDR